MLQELLKKKKLQQLSRPCGEIELLTVYLWPILIYFMFNSFTDRLRIWKVLNHIWFAVFMRFVFNKEKGYSIYQCQPFPSNICVYPVCVPGMQVCPLTVHDFHQCQGYKHMRGNLRKPSINASERRSPRDWIFFQNTGDIGSSSGLEAGLWLEGCHIPSATSYQSNE